MDIEKIKPVLESKVNELGYELVSLSFRVSNGERLLSLVIDRVEAISINDIVKVNEEINPLLDTLIEENEPSFNFEISSLGAEKPLKIEQLPLYLSRYVEVRTINPINGENVMEGELKEVNDEDIVIVIRIKTRVKDVRIQKSNINKIRLAIKF